MIPPDGIQNLTMAIIRFLCSVLLIEAALTTVGLMESPLVPILTDAGRFIRIQRYRGPALLYSNLLYSKHSAFAPPHFIASAANVGAFLAGLLLAIQKKACG